MLFIASAAAREGGWQAAGKGAMAFQASCSQPFSSSHRERFLTSQGEERAIPGEWEEGKGDRPLSWAQHLSFPSVPLLFHPAAVFTQHPPRRGDAPHPARSWGWAGAGCQPCWKQPEATHPPALLHTHINLRTSTSWS